LKNFNDTPSALQIWKDKKIQKIFNDLNVLTGEEIDARYEIELENYSRRRDIEASMTVELAINHIIPAAINYQSNLMENVLAMKQIFSASEVKSMAATQLDLIKTVSRCINTMKAKSDLISVEREKANQMHADKQAVAFASKVKPLMDEVRTAADELEKWVDDEHWPLPKMREILFTN
jgi:glutamine synthetase